MPDALVRGPMKTERCCDSAQTMSVDPSSLYSLVQATRALPQALTLRVHVPNNLVLGILVIVIIVQVWGKYMIIVYLDP